MANLLASPPGRIGRVVAGAVLALTGVLVTGMLGQATSSWTFVLVMLGAEIAVGGALNVCVLCPLFGLAFQGGELTQPLS